ncbi:MAG: hypothetical protein AAGJ29_13375, partial [Pseudomonadota bacterium]
MIAKYLSVAGLLFGAYAGFMAIIAPGMIARTLRLQANPERPGGYAEFRATFGGVFFMVHLTTLLLMHHMSDTGAALIVLPVAFAWLGAAIARLASMALDKTENGEGGINRYWVGLELVVAAMIAAPAYL